MPGLPVAGTATLSGSTLYINTAVTVVLSGQSGVTTNSFQWQSSATGTGSWITATGTTNSDVYTVSDSGLIGKYIRCVITASNSSGSTQTFSGNTLVAATPSSATVPTITSVNISPSTGTSGTLFTCSVTTAADPSVAISYVWRVYFDGIFTNVSTGPTYILDSVAAGGTLFCDVTAVNTAGSDIGSSNVPTVGLVISSTTPSAPQNIHLSAVDTAAKTATIAWDAPASEGGSTITSYEYQIYGTNLPGSGTWYTAGVDVAGRFVTLTLPTVGGTYNFSVAAGNSYGYGPSDAISFNLSEVPLTSAPITSQKNFIYPVTETVTNTPNTDKGYQTYLTKMDLSSCTDTVVAGLFFNMNASMASSSGTYYVEIVKYKDLNHSQRYGLVVAQDGTADAVLSNVLAFADITYSIESMAGNLPKSLKNMSVNPNKPAYKEKVDEIVQLKVVHYPEDPSLGNTTDFNQEVIRVYVNNMEVLTWRVISGVDTIVPYQGQVSNGVLRKIALPTLVSEGTVFGVYTSSWSQYAWTQKKYSSTGTLIGYDFTYATTAQMPIFLELYATSTPLKDPAENYYLTSKQFLTGLALGKREASSEKSYMMQTRPAVSGLNSYDVQYELPAATTAQVYPISYLMEYFPTNKPADASFKQVLKVHESALNYSALINTGFRGKVFIANNVPHLVWIKKEPDSVALATVKMNIYTYKLIAHAEQQILETIIDRTNPSEVAQIDSQWIQSKAAANKIVASIAGAIDGFSKDITLEIFGNPLIQVGDIVDLTYTLNGIQNKICLVQSVSRSFSGGLSTRLTLNQVGD